MRLPTTEEETAIFSKKDLLGLLPLINIALVIIFIILIPNFLIDLLLLFMLVLTIAFFLSMIGELWQQKQDTHTDNPPLIFNSMNISGLVLFAGQFGYGYFFPSFIFLGFIEVVNPLSIFIWIYSGFSTIFLVMIIWSVIEYGKEGVKNKKELKKNIMKKLDEHKKAENYAAQSYYLHLLIKVIETPLIRAKFLSKLLVAITLLLTIVPFIIPA